MEYEISQKKSPNFGSRNSWKPDMIVNHIAEGTYNGTISWLSNPNSKVSAHFVVSKKGEITQLVELDKMAWANGTSTNSIQKTFYNHSTLPEVRKRATNANYYTISIEHEGYGGEELTSEQLAATIWLHKYIIAEVERLFNIQIPINRNHIVGHYEINPLTKPHCPGDTFPWQDLLNQLRIEEAMDNVLKKWEREMGLEALEELNSKQSISNQPVVSDIEKWKETLDQPTPQWLFWSIINRIVK